MSFEGPRTVEVLAVQLLYELKHHAVQRPLPQHIPRGETFCPGRLSALVLSFDTELKLVDSLKYESIVFWNAVELSDDGTGLGFLSATKEMTAGNRVRTST